MLKDECLLDIKSLILPIIGHNIFHITYFNFVRNNGLGFAEAVNHGFLNVVSLFDLNCLNKLFGYHSNFFYCICNIIMLQ